MIYLLCFAVSGALVYASEQTTKASRLMLLAAGLAIPVLLAALRDPSVGRDVSNYVVGMFEFGLKSDTPSEFYGNLASYPNTKDLEYLFAFICYLVTRFTDNIGVLFAVYEIINLTFVVLAVQVVNRYLTSNNYGIQIPLSASLLCYYLLFYNMSLTMYRQSLACAICLYAATEYVSEKRLTAFIWLLIASLCHSTALFCILPMLLYDIVRQEAPRLKMVLAIAAFGAIALISRQYLQVLTALNQVVHVPTRYLVETYMASDADVNIAWAFLIAICLAESLLLYFQDRKHAKPVLVRYYLALTLFMVAMFPLSVISSNAGRLLYYLFYFAIPALPLWSKVVEKRLPIQGYPYLGAQLSVVLSFVFWLGTIGFNDYTDTANYVFAPLV